MSRARWHGPSALADQGPLPEGGSETFVLTFVYVRPGQPEGKGETLARWELTPEEYQRQGGRQGMRQQAENQRKAWARLLRARGFEGSVLIIKRRGFRRALWAVPAGVG